MINNHSAYIDFDNNKIKLTSKRLKDLKGSRKALRKKIRDYMCEEKKDEIQPKFYEQGSIAMGTAVNPIPIEDAAGNKSRAYDLDDGVYFITDDENTERRSIQTYHNWILNAVEGHTDKATDKTTCVRVIFTDGHHIDLPIYFMITEGIPELAHKTKEWIKSDPRAFSNWFNERADMNPQLRRIVRYLKAWKNFRETSNTELKLPSGFALTILVTENYQANERDDIAFTNTLRTMYESLEKSFKCWRPTTPKEDIFEELAESRKSQFMDALARLIKNCNKADEETNYKTSSEYLRKEFGDRFPLGKDEDVKEKKLRIAAGIAATVAPRPYCS